MLDDYDSIQNLPVENTVDAFIRSIAGGDTKDIFAVTIQKTFLLYDNNFAPWSNIHFYAQYTQTLYLFIGLLDVWKLAFEILVWYLFYIRPSSNGNRVVFIYFGSTKDKIKSMIYVLKDWYKE